MADAKGDKKKAEPKPAQKKTGKYIADFKRQHKHLFVKAPRNYGIGRAIQPKRDLTRFVKWPRYVRVQRQRAILKQRLKIPPPINHFSKTLEKNQAATLFALLAHYRPETREEKKKRLVEKAKAEVKEEAKDDSKKPRMVKYGLKHVTALVEARKAKLVIIAHDVDPIELVVWLPALCRRFDVPYCIVKGKARLGQLIHMKTATCLAVTDVRKEHQAKLQQIIDVVRPLYNEAAADRKKWGGGTLGPKAQAVIRLREKAQVKEAARLAKA